MNQDNIQQLRDKVADIKYDTQQVLNRIDSMDAAYQEQTGREQTLQAQVKLLEERIADMTSDMVGDANTIKQLNERNDSLSATIQRLKDERRLDKVCAPTMPVIPKAVAIAIFREGMAYGAGNVCDELDNATDIEINETGHTGGFEVSFTKYFDLSDELDLDYLRSKAVDNSDEERVVDCLKNLCADKEFECRIHGVDAGLVRKDQKE